MQSNFPIFDHTNVQTITNYGEISEETFVSNIVNLFNTQTNDAKIKFPTMSSSIQGLNLHIENNLQTIEDSINSKNVSIQTLPNRTGSQKEPLSVIQPTAWILNDEGSYYDPNEKRIMRNCVGYWDGISKSLGQHIRQTITNGCFMAYHFIVLFAIIGAITIKVIMDQYIDTNAEHGDFIKNLSVILIILVACGYDLVAILYIVLKETVLPDEGDPATADKIQKQVSQTVRNILNHIVINIPANELTTITATSNKQMTNAQIASVFIFKYFYEPAVTLLSQAVKHTSTAMYNPKRAKDLQWKEIEDVLILFRFVREISNSTELGTNDFKIDNTVVNTVKALVVESIKSGPPEVHIQLLRLLYKSSLSAEESSNITKANKADLSLNHYLGSNQVEEIRTKLEAHIKSSSVLNSKDPIIDQKRKNIATALNPNHLQSTTMTHTSSFTVVSQPGNSSTPTVFVPKV